MLNAIDLFSSLFSVVLIYSGLAAPLGGRTNIIVRVAIKEGVSSVELSGEGMTLTRTGKTVNIGNRARIQAAENAISVNGKRYQPPVFIRAARGKLYVNNSQYRGDLVIHRNKNGVLVVNELPLETYLVGLINAEVNSSWPRESLKAQAVVARTFALKKCTERASKLFDLRSDVSDQVYHGSGLEDDSSRIAVQTTAGQVLEFNGKIIQAYYHSTCGGHTASALEVWGEDLPYLPGVKCDWCVESPRYFWKHSTNGEVLGKALMSKNIRVGNVKKIRVLNKTVSGRNYRMELIGASGKTTIDAATMRAAVGYTKIFSTHFQLFEPGPGQFVFLGRGSGHGVGMCQWGANGLAQAGKSYIEILEYYYPGAKLTKR